MVLKKIRKIAVRIAEFQVEIWVPVLSNTKQKLPHDPRELGETCIRMVGNHVQVKNLYFPSTRLYRIGFSGLNNIKETHDKWEIVGNLKERDHFQELGVNR